MITENDAMSGMTIAHEQTVVADSREFAVRSSKMNRREFANHGTITNLDIADRPVLIFEVLRLHADTGIWKYLAHRTNIRVPVDDRTLFNHSTITNSGIPANMRIRPDFNIGTDYGAIFDNCRRMNFHNISEIFWDKTCSQRKAGDDGKPNHVFRIKLRLVIKPKRQDDN